jgi:hypothetical protein
VFGVHQIQYFPFLNGWCPWGGRFKNTDGHIFDSDVETRQFLNGHRWNIPIIVPK